MTHCEVRSSGASQSPSTRGPTGRQSCGRFCPACPRPQAPGDSGAWRDPPVCRAFWAGAVGGRGWQEPPDTSSSLRGGPSLSLCASSFLSGVPTTLLPVLDRWAQLPRGLNVRGGGGRVPPSAEAGTPGTGPSRGSPSGGSGGSSANDGAACASRPGLPALPPAESQGGGDGGHRLPASSLPLSPVSSVAPARRTVGSAEGCGGRCARPPGFCGPWGLAQALRSANSAGLRAPAPPTLPRPRRGCSSHAHRQGASGPQALVGTARWGRSEGRWDSFLWGHRLIPKQRECSGAPVTVPLCVLRAPHSPHTQMSVVSWADHVDPQREGRTGLWVRRTWPRRGPPMPVLPCAPGF